MSEADPEPLMPRFDRAARARDAQEFFDGLWAESDPWELDTSGLDQRRYARQLELLADRRYERALELGCAGGSFTRRLADVCDEVLAVDVSERAIQRARLAAESQDHVEYRVANVMDLELEPEGEWDLVVLTETAYYLGWQYPMFDLAWLAHELLLRTRPTGRLLLANSIWNDRGIMSPWLVRTYRDMFRNVGYQLELEESMRGVKDEVEFEILISLFVHAE